MPRRSASRRLATHNAPDERVLWSRGPSPRSVKSGPSRRSVLLCRREPSLGDASSRGKRPSTTAAGRAAVPVAWRCFQPCEAPVCDGCRPRRPETLLWCREPSSRGAMCRLSRRLVLLCRHEPSRGDAFGVAKRTSVTAAGRAVYRGRCGVAGRCPGAQRLAEPSAGAVVRRELSPGDALSGVRCMSAVPTGAPLCCREPSSRGAKAGRAVGWRCYAVVSRRLAMLSVAGSALLRRLACRADHGRRCVR
jgi:hypothetical protein